MPVRQGGKVYAQVLLDINRYRLLEQEAASQGKKVTGYIRDIVYKELETALPASEYRAAEALDAALWAEAVRRRVQGRQRSRQLAAQTLSDLDAAETLSSDNVDG